MDKKYDFSGWATKNDLRCSDGRVIRKNAFKNNDGQTVPLVWNHFHNELDNILGHALLENREDGVYAYCTLNHSASGEAARERVKNGDLTSLSIYANQLQQNGGDVLHGAIREVSLVSAGANPGAVIEDVMIHSGDYSYASEDEMVLNSAIEGFEFYHSDDSNKKKEEETEDDEKELESTEEDENDENDEEVDDETDENEDEEPKLKHSDDKGEENNMANENEKTVKDVFDELTEEQKNVVYFMIGQALEDAGVNTGGSEEDMKHNVFDNDNEMNGSVLSHADEQMIFEDARRLGSLRESVLMHMENDDPDAISHAITDAQGNSVTYGIANIDYLFSDYKSLNTPPGFVQRKNEWVASVMNGVAHTPFSRIKSMFADITGDDARAKGYTKGNKKLEEVFTLLRRTTDPQTVYKKQKLDRDDVLDITDFDVVAWLRGEMRIMLDEELARAILVGDGRDALSNDKISPDHIRPIWTDDDFYTIKKDIEVTDDTTPAEFATEFIDEVVRAHVDYRGSGNPVMFMTEEALTECLLLKDSQGYRIYKTVTELETALRVSKIITVPIMKDLSRTVTVEGGGSVTKYLMGIMVNLNDYNVGADKGGEVNMFDDFDIDYNQMKYLIETRCSGAMTVPYGAVAFEKVFQ